MMDDIQWLQSKGFTCIGHWSKPEAKLKREAVDHISGVYAFVVGRELRYLGKAEHLRGRARSYNRSLAKETRRELRKAHVGIRETWDACETVEVWVYKFSGGCGKTLLELETEWINERRPCWNGTAIGGLV